MKLYTEEQVREMLLMTDMVVDGDLITHDDIISTTTPIELPSDMEIEKEAFQVPYNNTNKFYDESFIKGAKWMRDKILNK